MSDNYDLVVIGGGAAGLTAAGLGASLGAKTLLVEENRLGGDCTWTGCVPSKTLLKEARVFRDIKKASSPGPGEYDTAFVNAMHRLRTVRQRIYNESDAPANLESFGVEVRTGAARFIDPKTVQINTREDVHSVQARFIVIASGSSPAVPAIPGLDASHYLTNESIFEMQHRPRRIAIIGAGAVGTEIAQAYQRFGVQVTVLERGHRILSHDHPELARVLRRRLEREGVRYFFGIDIEGVERAGDVISLDVRSSKGVNSNKDAQRITADALLIAVGRTPNVSNLGLDAAGVNHTEDGIVTDDRCRTNKKHIYAAGDVTRRYQFTHMSEHMAKVAVTNALLKIPAKIDAGRVPWVTFTDPELAHVGATEAALKERDDRYETYRFPIDRLDRAICESETMGELRIYATRWTGRILGADVLAPRAGEMIGTIAVAMKSGASLAKISDTIIPYPTFGLGVRRTADQWYARKRRPWLVRILQKIFGYQGPVVDYGPDRII